MRWNEKAYLLLMFVIIMGLLLFAGGCSNDNDEGGTSTGPSGGSSSATVNPATGGGVFYEDASVVFPPGAVNTSLEVTLGVPSTQPTYTAPADVEQIGDIYEAGPAGTQFNVPVTVNFSYSDNDLGGYDETTLTIWTFDQEGDTLTMLDTPIVDPVGNTVAATTTHFSYFLMTVSTTAPEEPPQTPVLSSPADGATNQPISVTLTWNASSGASEYHVQVATDDNFSNLFFDQSGVTGTSIGVGNLAINTTFYWRVMASNEYGDSNWSSTWSFTTGDGGGGGGGDIEGTWVYDHTDFNFVNPDPSYLIEMSGWVDEQNPLTVVFSGSNYTAEGIQWIQTTITVFEVIVYDESDSIAVDEGGTYTVEGNQLTTTVTYDNIDPSNVGETETETFNINGNEMTFTYSDNQQGYQVDITAYYYKQ